VFRLKGFTLIELLIVIAIILILISIALPNFMEAQVRAKVAQTKGNMRSIQMAMESHLIDWGDVVPDYNDIGAGSKGFQDHVSRLRARVPGGAAGCASPRAACRCTSPGDVANVGSVRFVSGQSGFYSPGILCPLTTPMKYLTAAEVMDPFGNKVVPHGYDTVPTGRDKIGYGAVFGMGPDQVAGDWRRNEGVTIDTNRDGLREGLPYSATNGTNSRGDFWRVIIGHDSVMAKQHFYPVLNW
jgi:prepilin-type N-terminal cleavage/methylation domain-containing protein